MNFLLYKTNVETKHYDSDIRITIYEYFVTSQSLYNRLYIIFITGCKISENQKKCILLIDKTYVEAAQHNDEKND